MNKTTLSRYEQAVMDLKSIDPDFKNRFCEILRTVRTSNPQPDEHRQIIWDTSSTIIGPAFFFFTRWVLQEAKKRNIRRLYFLSRDGRIFHKIAQIIDAISPQGIDLRYLYGSRHLWLTASIEKIGPYEID